MEVGLLPKNIPLRQARQGANRQDTLIIAREGEKRIAAGGKVFAKREL